ncbi:MAG: DUF2760 domain-containing protein [Planctomycetes bacterium]|nr:DUF2760 domain-containing protein [Planctomycetota bacterium]
MEPMVAVLLTLVGVAVLFVLFVLANGGFARFGLAWQAFTKALRDPDFAVQLSPLLNPPPPEPPKPVKPSGAPLRLLTVLQRESRLLDFLMEENLQGADDGQIAAAVRDIQPKAQATLRKYLTLEPVLTEAEGSTVTVASGFDPSAIQLVGNVTGQPPFRGVVRHAGWRVKELSLAAPPEGQDEFVLAPAEVELP